MWKLLRSSPATRQAQRLLSEGKTAYGAGRHELALGKWTAAGQLIDPALMPEDAARCDLYRGMALQALGRYAEAVACLNAVRSVLEHQRMAVIAECDGIKARALEGLGRYQEALDCLDDARGEFLAQNSVSGLATTDLNRGNMLNLLGRPGEAIEPYEHARQVFHALRNSDMETRCLLGLAAAYSGAGHFQKALEQLAVARAVFVSIGRETGVASCDLNAAINLRASGRFQEALPLLERAAAVYRAEGLSVELGIADSARAQIHTVAGDYECAIALFEQARGRFLASGLRNEAAQCQANKALLWKTLGRYEDAQAQLAEAAAVSLELGHTVDAARYDLGRASCLFHLGKLPEALRLYSQSRDAFLQHGLELDAADCRSGTAGVLLELERPAEALQIFDDIQGIFDVRGHAMASAVCRANRGQTLALLARYQEAAALLLEARQSFERLGMKLDVAKLSARLGWTAWYAAAASGAGNGALEPALSYFTNAIRIFETWRTLFATAENRRLFFESAISAYAGAVLTLAELRRFPEAFEYLERSLSRVLTESIAADESADLLELGSDLHREFLEMRARRIQAGLVVAPRDAFNRPLPLIRISDSDAVATEATELERWARRVAEQRPDSRFAAQLSGRDTWPVSMPELASGAWLEDRACLIEFFTWPKDDRLRAFLLTRRQGLQLLSFQPGSISALTKTWERWSELYQTQDLDDHAILVEKTCHALHEWIFGAEVELANQTGAAGDSEGRAVLLEYLCHMLDAQPDRPGRLFLVPHAFLGNLPLHAAVASAGGVTHDLVLSRFVISYAPSASILKMALQRSPSLLTRALVVGNPSAPACVSLPEAEEEARDVESKLRAMGWVVDPLYRASATKEAFLQGNKAGVNGLQSGAYGHMHLAQHASLDYARAAVTQRLRFAGADSASEQETDCAAAEIAQCPLQNVDCAVIAVCSGAATHPWMSEWSGLSAAFLQAGVRTVVSALYPLSDRGSKRLMRAIYEARFGRGMGWAEAVREAQLRNAEAGMQAEDPYVWACVKVVGAG